MPRIKWLEVLSGAPLRAVAQRLTDREFRRDGALIGFDLQAVTADRISARFIREEHVTEQDVDPYGSAYNRIYTKYYVFGFSISKAGGRLILRLDSPPRSLREFVSELVHVFDHDLAIQEINVDLGEFVKRLKSSGLASRINTRSAVFSDVPLTDSSQGRVVVISSADAVKDFRTRLVGGRLERVVVDARRTDATKFSFELSAKASLKFEDEAFGTELDSVESLIAEHLP